MAGRVDSIGGRVASAVRRARDAARAVSLDILPPEEEQIEKKDSFFNHILDVDGMAFDMNAPRGTYLNILV